MRQEIWSKNCGTLFKNCYFYLFNCLGERKKRYEITEKKKKNKMKITDVMAKRNRNGEKKVAKNFIL